MSRRARQVRRWILVGLTVLVVIAFGGPFFYNQFLAGAAPALLSLPVARDRMSAGNARSSGAPIAGRWTVGTPSVVGFRVPTDALGYRGTVVSRTNKVQGSLAIAGSTVMHGSFTVDLAGVARTASERTLLDVSAYPTATFRLTHPIMLSGTLGGGTVQQATATGALTVHGVTRSLTFVVSDERRAGMLYVLADLPITFADWHIAVPFGVEHSGTLEVLLALIPGAGRHT